MHEQTIWETDMFFMQIEVLENEERLWRISEKVSTDNDYIRYEPVLTTHSERRAHRAFELLRKVYG